MFEHSDGQFNKKRLWAYIKSLRREKVSINTLQDQNGKIVTSGTKKANVLSSQFKKVFTRENTSNIPQMQQKFPEMEAIGIAVHGVEKLLSNLNINKAMGPDKLHTWILKEYATILAPIITILFQQSLNFGVLPADWLKGNVIGLFKNKGKRTSAANYRPISLTCILCKLLEHIIFSHIMNHYDKYSILNKNQHGFQKGHSCETQLNNPIDEISLALDQNEIIDCIILDFTKAFDTVAHQRLLQKLKCYGINKNVMEWIKNWLTKRTQIVVVDGYNSNEEDVTSGVPQGTVLGPLMFLTYINDISENIDSKVKLFADDCLMYKVIKSPNDVITLQEDLNKINRWCKYWQMSFNLDKCKILQINTHKIQNNNYEYYIGDHKIESVKEHPYLGVEFNTNLSWGSHMDKITSKATRTLNMIRRNFHRCSEKIKKQVYTALVRPTLEYASSCWDPYENIYIDKIEMVQNRAARFIKRDYRWTSSVTKMKEELELQTLQERRLISRNALFYKALKGHAAISIKSNESNLSITHIPSRTDARKYSFVPRTARCWNIIPENIRAAETTEIFRIGLTKAFKCDTLTVTTPRGIYNRPMLGNRRKQNNNFIY